MLSSWSAEAGMQVSDRSGVRFCAVPSAGFASCLSIRELTVTHFRGAVAVESVRNSLRLCVAMLDRVLTLFSLLFTWCVVSFLQISFSGSSHSSVPVPLPAHSQQNPSVRVPAAHEPRSHW